MLADLFERVPLLFGELLEMFLKGASEGYLCTARPRSPGSTTQLTGCERQVSELRCDGEGRVRAVVVECDATDRVVEVVVEGRRADGGMASGNSGLPQGHNICWRQGARPQVAGGGGSTPIIAREHWRWGSASGPNDEQGGNGCC